MVCVGGDDAQAYVKWLTKKTCHLYRLPSESEWEYAARAGTTGAHYWDADTDNPADVCKYANVVDITFKTRIPLVANWSNHACRDKAAWTAPVASYAPNAYGLYDMSGNVWEWGEDCWHDSFLGAPANGTAWKAENCSARVLRGGGWGDTMLGTERVTTHGNGGLVERSVFTGFRVVRIADAN
ncbi:MAG: formylglycine-generating enzyme family protein [Candidatus Protistobacter heckmanni]|nr:formylglycine-generating enzyme family protein [Candidatus Protistobacter heckmanni]